MTFDEYSPLLASGNEAEATLETAEEGAARLLLEEVEEHVSEIMFDSLSAPEDDCLLCKRGIELGVWARYGVDDPFAPEDA